MRRLGALLLAGFCGLPAHAAAQDRPFVFSLTTSDVAAPQMRVDYEVGIGESAFHQQDSNGPEQRIGIQASQGRLTFVGHVDVSASAASDAYQSSQQAELLVSLFAPGSTRPALAIGGGVLHEAGGASVLLTRIVAGRETPGTRIHGNLLLEHPLATGRDAFDVITSIGWAARVTPALAIGVEGIGEDLEGFWDPTEAEGGARLLVGPSVHVAPQGKRWQLSVTGGPTFHPTTTTGSSDALRELPPVTGRYDYALRMTFSCRF